MPMLFGKRVMLREYRQEDLMEMRAWVNDPLVTEMLGSQFLLPQTFEMTEKFIARRLEGGYNFVIARAEDGAYLGQIDFLNMDLRSRQAELGIVLGAPSWCGQGFGSEAVGLMLKFGFAELNLNRVYLSVADDNVRAIRCYEKCGFVPEGRLRQAEYRHGVYHDILMMSVLRAEWLERQRRS